MDYSVIIPAYNASNTIRLCIRSILNQELQDSITGEIIVVDDGSTDDTREKVTGYNSSEPTLRILQHSENRGLAAARNTGLEASSGEILFFLDSDMTAEKDYIQSHLEYYESAPDISGIINKYVPGDETPRTKFTRYLYRKSRGAGQSGEGGTVPAHQILFGCTSMRRTVYEQVGGFDENLKAYGGDDTEYAFRITQQIQSQFIYTAKTELQHHHFRTLDRTRTLLYQYGKESVPYLVEKYPELSSRVGLDIVGWSADGTYSSVRKAVLLSSITEGLGRFLYTITPPPVSHIFVRYLLGVAVLRGFFEATE
ncbi:MAG: glycosyltransferase [Candidatus Marinimicrobia bacterium]|nr:glycosyltransferase [Candidatus Neomarinimicrobiota bacterium]MCF7827909.1 glycosyltransferase [Candidatus Neomarinimicrobiota bacterium]MCF7879336.1 glycosyltransferase [Candidatus Neomarinimicrobiota bacterium]